MGTMSYNDRFPLFKTYKCVFLTAAAFGKEKDFVAIAFSWFKCQRVLIMDVLFYFTSSIHYKEKDRQLMRVVKGKI